MMLWITSLLFFCFYHVVHADSSSILQQQADLFLRAGLYEKAIQSYQSILKENKDSFSGRSHLAIAYLQLENYPTIVALLESSSDLSLEERLILAVAYRKMGQSAQAIVTLHTATFHGSNLVGDYYLELGKNALIQNDLEKGRFWLKQGMECGNERQRLLATIKLARLELNKGLNCFLEAEKLIKANQKEEGRTLLEEAASSFSQAWILFKQEFSLNHSLEEQDRSYALIAIKHVVLVTLLQENSEKLKEAKLWIEKERNINGFLSSEELDHLYTLILIYLNSNYLKNWDFDSAKALGFDLSKSTQYYDIGSISKVESQELSLEPKDSSELQDLVQKMKSQPDKREKTFFLLGTFYYHQQEYEQAREMFAMMTKDHSSNQSKGDAFFWMARCEDQLHSKSLNMDHAEQAKSYRKIVFEQYPKSPHAAEAYFTYYTYLDYLQGDRKALKHLEALEEKFPTSPFLIYSFYLIGLDFKRDRKTAEGKWIRKKNLTAAIDAFQKAESLYDFFIQQGILEEDNQQKLLAVRYQAALERMLTNIAIAEESSHAKQLIYFEYAQKGLEELFLFLTQLPAKNQFFVQLENEVRYWLAKTYIKTNKEEKANQIFDQMIETHRANKTTRSYYLALAWYEKGLIKMAMGEYEKALEDLSDAEDAAKGKLLSSDQRLSLWIEKADCYSQLGQIEQAILTLSQAINDEAISSLRVKAMYLRAEAYEKLGKKELARRQWESTAQKGGEWGEKAKERLKSCLPLY